MSYKAVNFRLNIVEPTDIITNFTVKKAQDFHALP